MVEKVALLKILQIGVYCCHCFIFRLNDSGGLVNTPLFDWKNISAIVEKHLGVGSSGNSLHNIAASKDI